MYSWELHKFLEERDNMLTPEELLFVTDMNEHPQIDHVKYNPYGDFFEMWDNTGDYFDFKSQKYDDWVNMGNLKYYLK